MAAGTAWLCSASSSSIAAVTVAAAASSSSATDSSYRAAFGHSAASCQAALDQAESGSYLAASCLDRSSSEAERLHIAAAFVESFLASQYCSAAALQPGN